VTQGQRRSADNLIQDRLQLSFSATEIAAVKLIKKVRPPSIRAFDQIPMRSRDLLKQAKIIAPYIAGQSVAFMGDADLASLVIGLVGRIGGPLPRHMTLLDFDERLLEVAYTVARHFGFADVLAVQRYNAFDPVPNELSHRHDWFYTNPPYGSNNSGASAQLFITRGCELVRAGGSGCIILPNDATRAWTQGVMLSTQAFLATHGWSIRTMLDKMHHYHLAEDRFLTSSLVLVDNVVGAGSSGDLPAMPYAGRRVEFREIPSFYGRAVLPPYPRYIRRDGTADYAWGFPAGPDSERMSERKKDRGN
jgi:hypothetical protein